MTQSGRESNRARHARQRFRRIGSSHVLFFVASTPDGKATPCEKAVESNSQAAHFQDIFILNHILI